MANTRRYFVTGANGFIGSWLVHTLVQRNQSVIALTRRSAGITEHPPGLDWQSTGPLNSPLVEWRQGDITDANSVLRAMEGATDVFHLAAYARNWAPRPETFFEVNVQGTRNVFAAAVQQRIQRLVWTSSIVVLGPTPKGQVRNEDSPRMVSRYFTEYERTKAIAEQDALALAQTGVPIVTVLPTRVYGPGYLNESNSATRLIDEYDRGRMPFLINRGVNVGNWVYVEDVVQGLLLAMEKGRAGERYIIGGENASLKEFFRTIDEVSGKRHFQIPTYKFLPLLVAWLLEMRAKLFGIYPIITTGWMKSFLVDWAYSSAKAEQELGYRYRSLKEGIRNTYAWLLRVRKSSV